MKKIFAFFSIMMLFGGAINAQQTLANDTIYNIVNTMPVFIGNLSDYIKVHLHYPESALDNNTEGTVFISFIILKSGRISDIEIEKGVSADLDTAAVNIIRSMPVWSPGIQKGEIVNVRLHLPIKFSINKSLVSDIYISDKKIDFPQRKGLYAAPDLGLNGGSVAFPNRGMGIVTNQLWTSFTFTAGVNVGYMFNSHFGIFLNLQYLEFRNDYSISYNQYAGMVNYKFSSIQYPIFLKYISSKPGKVGLEISAGAAIGFIINANGSGSVGELIAGYPNYYYETVSISEQPDFNKNNFNAYTNAGLYIPLNKVLSFSLDINNFYGFGSIGTGNKDIAVFSTGPFQYYQGKYGNTNAILYTVMLNIKLGKTIVTTVNQDKK